MTARGSLSSVGLRVGLLLALASGCPGSSEMPTRRDLAAPPAPDQGKPPDAGIVVKDSKPAPPACSAAGVATDCNPLDDTGCGEGSCYVIKDKGSACVCPVGTAAPAADCASTPECSPSHGCGGTSPPGKCRPYCDPEAPSCPAAAPRCVAITTHTQFAICKE